MIYIYDFIRTYYIIYYPQIYIICYVIAYVNKINTGGVWTETGPDWNGVRTGPVRTERVQSGLLTSVCNSVYALLSELAIEYIVIINLNVFIYANNINTGLFFLFQTSIYTILVACKYIIM